MNQAQVKTERVIAALEHRETDRVPIGEFFWTNFLRRVTTDMDIVGPFDPYRYWDLDLIVITPNMDPHIQGIEVLQNTPGHKVVRTGFGATIERKSNLPMPYYSSFETQTFEQMEAFLLMTLWIHGGILPPWMIRLIRWVMSSTWEFHPSLIE